MKFKTIEEYEIAYDLLDDAVEKLTKRVKVAENKLSCVAYNLVKYDNNDNVNSLTIGYILGANLHMEALDELEIEQK